MQNPANQHATGTDDSKVWEPLIPNQQVGRTVFVRKQHSALWNRIRQDRLTNFYLCSLFRSASSLSSKASGYSSGTKTLTFDGAQIHYVTNSDGNVYIHGIEIDSSLKSTNTNQVTGLYKVINNGNGLWEVRDEKKQSMQLNEQWNKAHYAAVSGKFDSKEDAGEKLIEHISGAYKEGVSKEKNAHYSLYWQQDKHNSNAQADELASLIQQAQEQKASVNWLVHGEGCGTFAKALKIMATYPSLSHYAAQDEETVRYLRMDTAKQQVFFSNPRGSDTSEAALKKACEKAGLTFYGVNINPYDMKNADARNGFVDKALPLGAKSIVLGVPAALGLGGAEKAFNQALTASNTAIAMAALACGYIVLKNVGSNVSGYARSLKHSTSSTFGSGNEKWAA